MKMSKLEKIIKGLEECAGNGNCTKCQYGKEKQTMSCKKLLVDILALLKEDCHNCKLECLLQKYDEQKEKYDALLKEQEAVEPVTESSVYDPDTRFFVCGSCKKGVIDHGDKFCRWCGQAVKWDA